MLCTCQVLSFSLCPKPCSLHESSHIKASLSSTRTDETPSHSGRLTPHSCTLDTFHFITTPLEEKKKKRCCCLKGTSYLLFFALVCSLTWPHSHTRARALAASLSNNVTGRKIMICYHQSSSGQTASNSTVERAHHCHQSALTVVARRHTAALVVF